MTKPTTTRDRRAVAEARRRARVETESQVAIVEPTGWTGAPDEYRPPRYASPEPLLDDGTPWPSAGWIVAKWIEAKLVHGEGDALGDPVRLRPFQKELLRRLYQYHPVTGQLRYTRAIWGLGRGNAKTELAGFIGDAELLGPLAPRSPNVPLAAASFEQANKLFGAARFGIEGDGGDKPGPLSPYMKRGLHLQETKIIRPDRPGSIYRVAAIAGTNEGGLPSCVLCDEIHEWEGESRERVWTVMSKGARKRRVIRTLSPQVAKALGVDVLYGALHIGITTAGNTLDSLAGRMYQHGIKVATEEVEDDSFLFMWWQMTPKVTLSDGSEGSGWDLQIPDERRQAILEANPAAGSFLSIEGLEESFRDPTVPLDEFLRYNGNLFVSRPSAWLPEPVIDRARKHPTDVTPPPPKGTTIVLGFDGSNNRDCTALVGWCIEEDYGFVVEVFEPENGEAVSRTAVDAAVHRAFEDYNVLELAGDPPGWRSEMEDWEARYGTRTLDEAHDRVMGSGKVVRFETFVYGRFAPACEQFKADMLQGGPKIDGHPLLVRHLKNAAAQDTRSGQVIVKDTKNSPRKIDAADAAIIARTRAVWWRGKLARPVAPRRQAQGF
jgi:phage terminase large subunit-like protein